MSAVSDSAPARRRWSWKKWGGKFLAVSVIAHLLFGMGATYLVVQRISAKRKLTFQAGPGNPNPSKRAMEHKVQMAKRQSSMSAPAQSRRITTTGMAKVVLPEMPSVPTMNEASQVRMGGMGGTGMGFGPGGGGGGGGGTGGGSIPFFGLREKKGGGALVGNLYDFKQTSDRKPTNMVVAKYEEAVREFVKKGFSEESLKNYFKGPKPLYTSQVFIPQMKADEGPKAFGLAGKVEPKMWIVHYKGKVVPPESGKYRFVGAADDILIVRFKGDVVLDAGCQNITGFNGGKYTYDFLADNDGTYKGRGHVWGKWVEVKAGESYDMEVVIGEQPGGYFFAWLQIEKEGATYEKDKAGTPILPIFQLAAGKTRVKSDEAPPHAKEGQIWKVGTTMPTLLQQLK